ncbi:MAG: FAD-binding oxidoreductase [Solirubrobacteraceae bacterium]|nr:FAD-binding oxidoreductase [Solirubrobacteraceae bacterium]
MDTMTRRTAVGRGLVAMGAVMVPQLVGTDAAVADTRRLADAVRPLVRGPVWTLGSVAYEQRRLVHNTRFDWMRPPAIVEPADADDVRTLVAWADRNRVRLVPRGGGHGYTGAGTSTTGWVVDLRRLREVELEGTDRVVIGGGARLSDVTRLLGPHDLAVPAGSCPTVGFAGLALGGGVGAVSRAHGLTLDRVTAVHVVTPNGVLRRADATTDPDLFWACRGGGGGNFGIVTAFEVAPVPIGPETRVAMSVPWSAAERALALWQELAPSAPDELMLFFSASTRNGAPRCTIGGRFIGSADALRSLVAPIIALPGVSVAMETAGHAALDRSEGGEGVQGRERFFAGSAYAEDPLPPEGIRRLLGAVAGQARRAVAGPVSILLTPYGGAINRVPEDATAFAHRDQLFGIQFRAITPLLPFDEMQRTWVRVSREALAPWCSGAAYVNYLDADQRGWERAYYGAAWERLVRVKQAYDPAGRLGVRQGIPLR